MRMPAALLNPSQARPQGLPHYTGARRPVGATTARRGSAMGVIGSPSMRVVKDAAGGAKTLLRRSMSNADMLSDEDFKALRKLIEQVVGTAKRLSNGGLSYKDLARMNHPYGKGARRGVGRLRGSGRGVSNMAITNRHSGDYQRAWNGELLRDKSGVTIALTNDVKYAAYLAFGTRRMKAHSPQTTAMSKHKAAIDVEWRRLARMASSRANALEQVGIAARGEA